MNFLLPLKSFFAPKSSNSTQSAEVSGNQNIIDQRTIHNHFGSQDNDLKRDVVVGADASEATAPHLQPMLGAAGDTDAPEIQRILDYRDVATKGDANTALTLLKGLENEPVYQAGYPALRLHFNIGIVQNNIGETELAVGSLRRAHDFLPDSPKAQTALAFSELLENKFSHANRRATTQLAVEGSHQDLAACIVFHAAKMLGEVVEVSDHLETLMQNTDVLASHLDYVRLCVPDEYEAKLFEARANEPDDAQIATMWADYILQDMRQNQDFLLGAKMDQGFDEKVKQSADILKSDLEKALEERPPNKLLLPSQANNAAVALRLTGEAKLASALISKVVSRHSELESDLAQVRAVLCLQQDKDEEALRIIRTFGVSEELKVMGAELEAQFGAGEAALAQINAVLSSEDGVENRARALSVKARMAIALSDQNAADEALEELDVLPHEDARFLLLKSAYERAFTIQVAGDDVERLPIVGNNTSVAEKQLIASLENSENWDFQTRLHAADELLWRGLYRDSADLLKDRVSLEKESPALETLCDACLRGQLGSLAREINDGFSDAVRNSVFGWKFGANVAYLNGEVAKAVPLTKRLFDQNPTSLSALDWYVQSLMRANDRSRIQRLINGIDDRSMTGSVPERREYVNLLVFCGEIERARKYAYRLFCHNQNDHRAWMSLSSSVLAFGRPPGTSDDFAVSTVSSCATFEVRKPDSAVETFTIEEDPELLPLREGNIPPEHKLAIAAAGKAPGDVFYWPFKGGGAAKIISVKHQALAAFHMILARFEERFPEVSGFTSVSVDVEKEDGLDEIKAMLKERADYSQDKAREYSDGRYPIYILGYHLGLDPIDTILGLFAECGRRIKVSSCTSDAQEQAAGSLSAAKQKGIMADVAACYLMRRLGVEEAAKSEFGPIGVTQHTIDVFARRLQEAEASGYVDDETGTRRKGSMAIRDGNIILTEYGEDEISTKVDLLRSDLDWLKNECELIPSVAKSDPNDAIIRFRKEEGGRFFDDVFAANGSGRILLSDDYHLRDWASGLFHIKTAWLQALLFHLEAKQKLPTEDVVQSTLHLLRLGQDALSINTERLLIATEMLGDGRLEMSDFEDLCSLIGQPGAELRSHVQVAASTIIELWNSSRFEKGRYRATSAILRNLIRHQTENAAVVLDTIQALSRHSGVQDYIQGWKVGHFIA